MVPGFLNFNFVLHKTWGDLLVLIKYNIVMLRARVFCGCQLSLRTV